MNEPLPGSRLRRSLALAALATALAGAWLTFVVMTVLPARDPSHSRLWSSVATGCFLFSFMAGVCARSPALTIAARLALFVASSLVLAAGVYGIESMLRAPAARFEGYVLILGAILAISGAIGLCFASLAGRFAPAPDARA